MGKSLGLIEVVGLPVAVEAGDAAVKSANVELVGYELTRGGGFVTVKVRGDVGAVKAAVDAATVAAERIGMVVSSHVIPRPASGTEDMVAGGNMARLEKPGLEATVEKPIKKEPVKTEEVKKTTTRKSRTTRKKVETKGTSSASKAKIEEPKGADAPLVITSGKIPVEPDKDPTKN